MSKQTVLERYPTAKAVKIERYGYKVMVGNRVLGSGLNAKVAWELAAYEVRTDRSNPDDFHPGRYTCADCGEQYDIPHTCSERAKENDHG